jgi:protein-S-isoprenylcysteine O-methyltransferase Ste14
VPLSEGTVPFRLRPPVAIGAPLLIGWLATTRWGDPADLGGWRVPLGWLLVLLFVGWNGWSLWLFSRHETGLLPGQATHAVIEEGSYRLSRNPLYVGLLALYLGLAAPTFWDSRAVPGRGAARPLGRDPARGAVPARAVRCALRRLHAAGTSLAVNTDRLATCTTGRRSRSAAAACVRTLINPPLGGPLMDMASRDLTRGE